MEQFGFMIDSEDTVSPPAVKGFLEELRTLQAPLVTKREKELDFLTTIQPQDVTVSAFEAWISRVEGIQERVRIYISYTGIQLGDREVNIIQESELITFQNRRKLPYLAPSLH